MSSKTQLIPLVTGCIPQRDVHSALDCGCGFGKWAGIMRTHLPWMANAYIVGLDIFRGSLKFCKKYGAYDDLVLGDIKHLPFIDNSIDVIVACEVIEHIEKEAGFEFLVELERISDGRVLVSTPNGSWPENPVMYKDGSVNLYEQHRSAWNVSDFSRRGYTVRAIGLKLGRESSGRLMGQVMAGLDFLLFPAWFVPNLGRHMVAYKDKRFFKT